MFKKLLMLIPSILFFQSTYAGHIGNVKIEEIRLQDTYVVIKTDAPIVPAQCAVSKDGVTPVDRYIFYSLNESSAANRKLAALMSAHAQGKVINPYCTDTCSDVWASWLGKITICYEVYIR